MKRKSGKLKKKQSITGEEKLRLWIAAKKER
jgi:hypothetical protein